MLYSCVILRFWQVCQAWDQLIIIMITIIIIYTQDWQNESEYSPVVHDVSSSLRWLSSSHTAVKRGWTNPFYPSHVSTHVHVSVKISPARLSHISNRKCKSFHMTSMYHLEHVSHQHNCVFSRNYIVLDFSEKKEWLVPQRDLFF